MAARTGGAGGAAAATAVTAEGRGDPSWSPPEAEGPRMGRIFAAIAGGPIPGRAFSYEGLAAYGISPDNVLLVVAKSQNDNAVIYVFTPASAGRPFAITPYWLSIEPSSREKHLRDGNPSLLSPLSFLEESLGYGVDVTPAPGGRYRVAVAAAADHMRDRPMELMTDPEGRPFLQGTLGGRAVVPSYAYLQMKRGLTALESAGLDALEYIRISGTDMTAGESFGQVVAELFRP